MISDGTLTPAKILKADIQAGQSIIHLIDSVLVPPPFVPLFRLLTSSPTIKPVTYTATLSSSGVLPRLAKPSAAKGTVSIQVVNSTYARGILTLSGINNAISAQVIGQGKT